ncbi:hypothetical protein [Actinophytocola sp.]|uniref:hypothetical protein n=1 Tax=Actinophytocola sp. TaxID=1872138 RepID=UPI002ED2DF4D
MSMGKAGGAFTVLSLVGPPIGKVVKDARTVTVRDAGALLVASLRDAVVSGSVGAYNTNLVRFTKVAHAAARTRLSGQRRQQFRVLVTSADHVCRQVTTALVGEASGLGRPALLVEIDTLAEQFAAL